MANVQNSNSLYIHTTGSLTTTSNVRVSHIIFTPDAANDQLVLKDADTSGDLKLSIRGAVAKQTIDIQLITPLVFPGGIYVSTITSGAIATLITAGPGI